MKSSKKSKLIPLALLAAGAFLLLQKKGASTPPKYTNVPPAPSKQNYQEYLTWVKQVSDLYGQAKSLWEPGGPFYSQDVPEPSADPVFWDDVSNIAGIGKRPPAYHAVV